MMHPDEILSSLTPAQREAAAHVEGPLLILAGPGSGKTRVVTHRIAYLLSQGIAAEEILALTFTNKAADEMRGRVERLVPGAKVWLGTFHRFCAMLLRRYAEFVGLASNYSIYDSDDSLAEVRQLISELKLDINSTTPERIARAISWAKSSFVTPDKFQPNSATVIGPLVHVIYPHYQRRLLETNAVDFDDLLLLVAQMLKENPELRRTLDGRYRYILVDEYQDTNLAQYAIVRALSQDYPNLAVTGDPDQSIYGWRGANLNNILEFERDYPQVHVVRLEQNYRSTKKILHVASELILHNVRRKHKELFTDNSLGQPVRLVMYPSYLDEANDIARRIAQGVSRGQFAARDCAILYRTNALSRAMEHALGQFGLPYQIVKGLEFYQRKEIKDVVAYLCLINNPRDERALRRIINLPQRGIGDATLERLTTHARSKHISLLDACREAGLVEGVAKRSAIAVAKFVVIVDRLGLQAAQAVETIVREVLAQSGYSDMLLASDDPEDEERLANVEELRSAAQEFDVQSGGSGSLEAFLEQNALVNDVDGWETEIDKVTLMTLHAAKGLEFSRVFIIGLEEGLLPHQRSRNDSQQMEEERRLLFVGITRAKQELQLSYAAKRMRAGAPQLAIPSCFLMELPRHEMEIIQPNSPYQADPECQLNEWDDEFPPRASREEPLEPVVMTPDAGPEEPSAPSRKSVPVLPKLRTAAEMLAGPSSNSAESTARLPPEAFHTGMIVNHPEHGLGKIVGLSGVGKNSRASVYFFALAEEKSYVLEYAQLRPASS